MKRIVSLLCCWAVAAAGAFAQTVSVDVVLDREQYLSGEEFPVEVKITNLSGRTLTLGKDENWLSFAINGGQGRIVSQRGPLEVKGEFELGNSMVAKRRVKLVPAFDLSRPGRYKIKANVFVPQPTMVIESGEQSFNIISGTLLWDQDFGVPSPDGTNRAPEMRKYALLQVTHEKELKLYFRLTDVKGTAIYRVFEIGTLVSFSKPEGQLDQWNNLHVLYQNAARTYLYCMINPDGVGIVRETYEITASRPTLRPIKGGRITVVGGARRYTPYDLPPVAVTAPSLSPDNAVSPQQP